MRVCIRDICYVVIKEKALTVVRTISYRAIKLYYHLIVIQHNFFYKRIYE